jgi:NAD(P)-dependent dehydrogenase (short-subunit alcohol dehydrogenase family)
MQQFNAKAGIVTGASRGIGRGIATLLAHEGARVVVNYYSGADAGARSDAAEQTIREIQDAGGNALALDGDISKPADVRKLIDFTLERYGTIDFLVNNAGIHPVAGFFDVTEEMWDRVHSVNLKGVFLCTQAVAKVMVED